MKTSQFQELGAIDPKAKSLVARSPGKDSSSGRKRSRSGASSAEAAMEKSVGLDRKNDCLAVYIMNYFTVAYKSELITTWI